MNKFIKKNKTLLFNLIETIDSKKIEILAKNFKKFKSSKNNKIIFLGNGGSASICNHVTVDLSKNAGIRSINFNEANLITCLSNDYGHDNWMKEALKIHCLKKDFVVFISSSGESKNIINASEWCRRNKIKMATFSGFKDNNTLKKNNKNGINFWIDSKAYNHVELCHLYILLTIVDMIIGKFVYKFN